MLAAPVAAALPPLAAALVSAALDAAEDELLVLLEVLLHAVSTNATALTPAMIAVNFFAGLWVTRPTSVSQGEEMCEGAHIPPRMEAFSTDFSQVGCGYWS